MIWYDWYRGHDVWTLGGAEEEVIGGMAGHFTRKFYSGELRGNWVQVESEYTGRGIYRLVESGKFRQVIFFGETLQQLCTFH